MDNRPAQSWLGKLEQLVQDGNTAPFYSWQSWRRLRQAVRRLDHYECQRCKARGRYHRGSIVHHVKHLDQRPDLALSIWDKATGERQLITVCKSCHEELHPESMRQNRTERDVLTPERWD